MKNGEHHFKIKLLTVAVSSALLAACGGGGSSSTTTTTTTGSTATAASGYTLPSQMEVVSVQDGSSASSLFRSLTGNARAYNDTGTDYSTAEQRAFTWNPATEPIGLANTIMCFMEQMKAEEQIDKGAYNVLLDPDSCDEGSSGGDNNGQSSGASSVKKYTAGVVNSEAQADGSVLVSVWVPEMNMGDNQTAELKVKSIVRSGKTDSNPIGDFSVRYQMADSSGQVMEAGEMNTLDATTLANGKVGFTVYSSGMDHGGGGGTYESKGSVVMAPDQSDGVALTANSESSRAAAFALSYNSGHAKIQKAADLNSLPYKSGDQSSNAVCLDRSSFKEAVWRYGLYDDASGQEIAMNGGFPFLYDNNSDGDNTDNNFNARGYAGFWGLWTEDGEADGSDSKLAHGQTIQREDQDNTQYTVFKAPGRLIKNTIKTVQFSELGGIQFRYWDGNVPAGADSWVARLNSAGTAFEITGKLVWQQNSGPTEQPLDSTDQLNQPDLSTASAMNPINMYSEQLGGNVNFTGGTSVRVAVETVVTAADADVFPGGATSATFQCEDQCIKGGLTTSDLSTFNGPFQTGSGPFSYTLNTSDMTLMSGSSSVVFPSGTTSGTNWDWGVRSGPMGLNTAFDFSTASDGDSYYVWETGPSQWNQFSGLKLKSDGSPVTFDQPLQILYTHSTANDRRGSSAHDGESVLLSYEGKGELHGIPGKDVSDSSANEESRWYPAFNIKDGVQLTNGSSTYRVKALDMERKMNKVASSNCSSLVLNDPAAAVPTGTTIAMDIGDAPTVSGAPKYIVGVAQ